MRYGQIVYLLSIHIFYSYDHNALCMNFIISMSLSVIQEKIEMKYLHNVHSLPVQPGSQ